jgi:PncC family amidohydrolase
MTVADPADDAAALADRVGTTLRLWGGTVAVAESVAGGSIAVRLAAAGGASDWFQGALLAYSKDVKFSVLGVRPGSVITAGCARLCIGVARVLNADFAVGTTGAGGPGVQEGQPAGMCSLPWPPRGTARCGSITSTVIHPLWCRTLQALRACGHHR